MLASTRRSCAGFTLVELLVVIGIIALLVGILLPSLNKARKAAVAVRCLANERSIGQAFMMYAVDFKGAIVPCYVWHGTAGDAWPFFLIQGHYLPDPRIQGGTVGPATSNSVLVCPAVRDLPASDGTAGFNPVATGTNDGYDRRASVVLLPSSLSPTPEPTTNGASGACIVDIGYGVNGVTALDGMPAPCKYMPMQGVVQGFVATASVNHTGGTSNMAQFRHAVQTVLLFDGTEWNPFSPSGSAAGYMWRISGSRHGNWQGPVGTEKSFSTGICNVLFLDGHAAAVNRSALPLRGPASSPYGGGFNSTQMLGNMTKLVDKTLSPGMTNAYVWNRSQE